MKRIFTLGPCVSSPNRYVSVMLELTNDIVNVHDNIGSRGLKRHVWIDVAGNYYVLLHGKAYRIRNWVSDDCLIDHYFTPLSY